MTDSPSDTELSVDFHTFIMSLGTSAMFHLGEIPDPEGGRPQVNLEMARQTIDILAMLEKKTSGNLSPEESKALGNLLYDLRMTYLKHSSK